MIIKATDIKRATFNFLEGVVTSCDEDFGWWGVSFTASFLFIRLEGIKKKYVCVCVCVF